MGARNSPSGSWLSNSEFRIPNSEFIVTDWFIFAFIVFVIVLDDVLREMWLSFTATRDFVLERLRWIVLEKLQSVWRGGHR